MSETPWEFPQISADVLDWINALRTYPDNPARQELLDRLNMRWQWGDEPPPVARYYRSAP